MNFSQFAIGMRQQVSLVKSISPGFMNDEVYYRLILRADGQGRWSEAITPRRGTDALSWVVNLATRA